MDADEYEVDPESIPGNSRELDRFQGYWHNIPTTGRAYTYTYTGTHENVCIDGVSGLPRTGYTSR